MFLASVNILILVSQGVAQKVAQEGAPSTGGGYISPLAWTIIVAMATAIAAEGVLIKMLIGRLNDCQEKRVKALEDQLALVRTTKNEMKPPEGGNQ